MDTKLKDLYCELCHLQFDKKSEFFIHLKGNHKQKEIMNISEKLGQSDVGNENIVPKQISHISLPEGKKVHNFDTCSTTLTKQENLEKHIASIHEDIQFNCDICNSNYTSKYGLEKL